MALDANSLNDFHQIYLQEFGEELTDEELHRKALLILNLYKAIYGDPKERLEELRYDLEKM
ncbi:MAG TPA: hypothetical protein PK609_00220 [Candidatus Paceibacterota bacterium]|nr:hypothetical protein [Candidatus Paceibacterota bacterium]